MKYLIIPGLSNSGEHHWQTIWETKYPDKFIRVEQKNWSAPDKEEWVKCVNTFITNQQEPLTLVAHSLGCITVVHWAQHYFAEHVKAALLVAPADVERSKRNELKSFAPIPLKKLPINSIIIASTNDPFASIERTRLWATAWGSMHVNAGTLGHINSLSGIGEWNEGLNHLSHLLNTTLQY